MAHDTRYSHGLALGPYASFWGSSTANALIPDDTTPDVTDSCLFFTRNTAAATAITNFDLRTANTGGLWHSQFEGKVFKLIFLDTATTIVPSTKIYCSDTMNKSTIGTCMEFIYHNSAWYEVSRSVNATNGKTLALSDANSSHITDVTGYDRVVLTGTDANLVIKSISGGTEMQEIQIYAVHTNGITVSVVTNGNILYEGSNQLVINASGVYDFQKRGSVWWYKGYYASK